MRVSARARECGRALVRVQESERERERERGGEGRGRGGRKQCGLLLLRPFLLLMLADASTCFFQAWVSADH